MTNVWLNGQSAWTVHEASNPALTLKFLYIFKKIKKKSFVSCLDVYFTLANIRILIYFL